MSNTGRTALITLTHPRSPVTEAYRSLRTNLEFSSLDRPLRTMIVTSAAPEEGKSTTLANLAVTMAQAGKRVILVDADLRRPVQHTLFGLRDAPGLTNLVIDADATREPPLQPTGIANLQLLASGPLPPNPSELLGSRRMTEIIAGLAERAEVVLFDAPPVIAVTDAAVLASRVDGVLLVIYAGKTRREHVEKARALLDKVNARIVGTVLTNVRPDASLQYYYTTPEQG
jgi:non-specific protein-tyrosine kinase